MAVDFGTNIKTRIGELQLEQRQTGQRFPRTFSVDCSSEGHLNKGSGVHYPLTGKLKLNYDPASGEITKENIEFTLDITRLLGDRTWLLQEHTDKIKEQLEQSGLISVSLVQEDENDHVQLKIVAEFPNY